jgi:excinuclease Cho
MAHMRAEDEREMMSQTLQVDCIETAGEIGALLLESHMIKSLNPIFNVRLRRLRKLCTLQVDEVGEGLMPVIVSG